MRHTFAFIFIISCSTCWSQVDSSELQLQRTYLNAYRYLSTFKYFVTDSIGMKYFKRTPLRNTTPAASAFKLIVSNDPMPACFNEFYGIISNSNACNPIKVIGNVLSDSLDAIDKVLNNTKSSRLFNWPDSLTQLLKPNFIVFFSKPFRNICSAELFIWYNPSAPNIIKMFGKFNQKYHEYASYNSSLRFLFCT